MGRTAHPVTAGVLAVLMLVPHLLAQPAAEQAVLQTIDQVNAAFQRRDVKAYEALVTSDFVRVGGDGRVFGRADWLKNAVAAPGPPRQAGTFDEASVRTYGDAALVTYRNKPVTADGKPGPVGYLTRVFEKQGSQWKLAFAQSTDQQPPAAPASPAPSALPAWSATTPLEKEALTAFQAIQKANRDRDVAGWERLSAPDHLIITAEGRRMTRAERVAALKAPPPANAPPGGAESDLRLTVRGGSLAVATWRAGETRSLKVLAKTKTGWQQVLQQTSPIVAPKS